MMARARIGLFSPIIRFMRRFRAANAVDVYRGIGRATALRDLCPTRYAGLACRSADRRVRGRFRAPSHHAAGAHQVDGEGRRAWRHPVHGPDAGRLPVACGPVGPRSLRRRAIRSAPGAGRRHDSERRGAAPTRSARWQSVDRVVERCGQSVARRPPAHVWRAGWPSGGGRIDRVQNPNTRGRDEAGRLAIRRAGSSIRR